MDWLSALILGIVQGLTEFLPVSSSGHLELGKVLLNIEEKNNITFSIVVHGATVLSTIVVFRNDLAHLFRELFTPRWNEGKAFIAKIFVSMVPFGVVGFFFKDHVRQLFTGDLVFVGSMLLITALLLVFANYAKSRHKAVGWLDAFIIGVAQAFAVLPGISRSGATIATALLLGNDREKAARFSFLMVLLPIIAVNVIDIIEMTRQVETTGAERLSGGVLLIGFLAAFVSGWAACRWMINIVKRSKLQYFAVYCLVIGSIAIFAGV